MDSLDAAVQHAEEMKNPLIFVHSGTYLNEYVVIESNIQIVGAGEFKM